MRGEIIPVFDLGGPAVPLHPSRFILISMADGDAVGLIVDEVHEVVTLSQDRLTQRMVGGRCYAVARVGEDVLSVLDPSVVVNEEG